MKIKHYILTGLALSAGLVTMAQQDAMFTHYMFNTLSVNPGYAGSREVMTVSALAREQWVGIGGRPRTQTLVFHTPIRNEHIGLGLSVVNDQAGPIQNMAFYGDFAYRLKLGSGKLAFGLKAGINRTSAALSTLENVDPNDVQFQSDLKGDILPNFGFGMYYYTERFYAGISTPKLLENSYSTTLVTKERRHYFAIIGAVFDVTNDIKFKPTGLMKVVEAAPLQIDLTASFIFHDKLSAGVMYRTNDAIGALIGYQFTDQLRAGYSYDFTLTDLNNYNSGSHEIMISYDFAFGSKQKIKSPRYF